MNALNNPPASSLPAKGERGDNPYVNFSGISVFRGELALFPADYPAFERSS